MLCDKFHPSGLIQFVEDFAILMLQLTAVVVFGTDTILAFSVRVSLWRTVVYVESAESLI